MFWMTDGKLVVTVRVSDEALSDAEGSMKPNASTLTVFQRRRYAVESVARRKIVNERREKDGSIMVKTIDLNG
jgi:hypothetical protein